MKPRRATLVRASEQSECGLASLTMVANAFGVGLDLSGMRERMQLSGAGMTLQTMLRCADELGLSARAVRVDLEGLDKLDAPAVLHWDLNHFVVYAGRRGRLYRILDPALGERDLPLSAISPHFTGVAVEFEARVDLQPLAARPSFRLAHLLRSVRGLKTAALTIAALTLGVQLFSLAVPIGVQLSVDNILEQGSTVTVTSILLAVGIASLCAAGLEYVRAWSMANVSIQFGLQLIAAFGRHLLSLPFSFYARRNIGDLLSRVGSATVVQDFLTRGAVTLFLDATLILSLSCLMIAYSLPMAAVFFAFALGGCLVTAVFQGRLARSLTEQINARAAEQTVLIESLRSILTIKLLGHEDRREAVWRNRLQRAQNAAFAYQRTDAAHTALQTGIFAIQLVLILAIVMPQLRSGGGFTLGMLTAFLAIRQILQDRITSLLSQLIQLRMVFIHVGRLGDVASAEAESRSTARGEPASGELALEDVSFAYGTDAPVLLRNIDLRVQPGEYIGISGKSGEGKTTLLKVLTGLYPPTSGQVLLDGVAPDSERWRWWRQHIGVVSQDDKLMSGTIAENIAFFDPDLDQERVEAAAKAAGIHEQILDMPMRYSADVGDLGSILSGGQRQRLFIARALYREPRILILDEGTANLDLAAEAEFGAYLRELEVTRIVVSHRPLLLDLADRVLELRQGGLWPLEDRTARTA